MTPKEGAERIAQFEILKRGWDENPIPRLKTERAQSLLVSAIRLARDLCGEDLLREVYGVSATDSRADQLKQIARRTNLASYIFLPFDDEPNGLRQVAQEAYAIAEGAPPDLFAQVGNISKYRIDVCRFDALRWLAYLNGFEGLSTAERQAAVTVAFKTPWETLRKWKAQLTDRWGQEAVQRQLQSERRDAKRNLRRWMMHPGETWQDALNRSGQRYIDVQKRHASLAEGERKK